MGIFDIFTNKNAQDAANAEIAGINQGYGDLSGLYGQARGAITDNFTQALQPFLKNLQTGQQGTSALTDALGITGDPSQVRARLAATPGYSFALNTGNENVLRNAAATGQLASGKTNMDLTNYGQGLADQTYNNYVSQLSPFLNFNQSAASGAGNILTGQGSALASLFSNQGNAAFGADTSKANAQANADLANNAASANIWSAIMGGGKALASALPSLAMFSDERLKEDVESVGELYDGTGVYRYKYIGDPTPRIGLIAQEVEAKNPDAVVEVGGFKAVRYDKATEFASKLSRFLEAA